MTTILSAIINGETTYNLTDGDIVFRISEDGLGMSPVRRITERGPLQHGVTDLDFRLEPRVIQLIFGMYGGPGSDEATFYDLRAQVLRIFRPTIKPITLHYLLANGATRCIDCHLIGGMGFPSSDRVGHLQKFGVQLSCADPTFYDPETQTFTYGIGGGSVGFTVPVPLPFGVGNSNINQTRALNYTGSWRCYPFIRLKGPITDAVVTNQTTSDTLNFTGVTIANGDYYDIDCRYGYKTVTDASGTNRIDKLTDDSDLATFSLEADPEAAGGDNVIAVEGTSVTSNSEIYIQYNPRYVGI